mmetsp:Transcript_52105/g.118912  ORF Transcript_52105/g.118912 Transcript_52105/m.118912 type:complete len:151 (-) Transcript_52105:263-715(-)
MSETLRGLKCCCSSVVVVTRCVTSWSDRMRAALLFVGAMSETLRGSKDVDHTVSSMADADGPGSSNKTQACGQCAEAVEGLTGQSWCSSCFALETQCAFKKYALKTTGEKYTAKKEFREQDCNLDHKWYWACNVDTATHSDPEWEECESD